MWFTLLARLTAGFIYNFAGYRLAASRYVTDTDGLLVSGIVLAPF